MDYAKILTRSFEIVWKNRALWLFGILLALFGGSGGGGGGGGFPGGSGTSGQRGTESLLDPIPQFPPIDWNALGMIIAVIICALLVVFIIGIVLRFISRAALIGLVNELETDQTVPTVRRGFSIGWSRFMPLFGIAILINLPLMLFGLILLAIAAFPFLGALSASGGTFRGFEDVLAFAGAGSVILLCCVVMVLILVSVVVRPIYEFIVRACVVGNRGAMDSIREGFRIVRANLGKVFVLYILVIAVGIGIGIVMIPITLFLVAIPLVVGFVAYLTMNALVPALIAGAMVGIPMLLILIFISGLIAAYESTMWTEGYLEVARL